MSGLIVPQLSRKLRMLVEYGHVESLQAVAKALNRRPVTIRGWVHGSSGGAPERIPSAVVSALVELYRRALPELPHNEVRRLLQGPADDLEAFFAAGSAPPVADLIAQEGDSTRGKLFVQESGALSLARRRSARSHSASGRVSLGQDFRIEFATTSRAGFVVAFQSAPGGWGGAPSNLDAQAGRIHIPGYDEAGRQDWLYEENEIGPHRFIAAQGRTPFPAELSAAARDGVTLDRTLLQHFARDFERQEKSSRRLYVIEIEFVRPAATQ